MIKTVTFKKAAKIIHQGAEIAEGIGARRPTNSMTTREIADYLDRQKNLGWPGSVSIHPFGRRKKKTQPVEQQAA